MESLNPVVTDTNNSWSEKTALKTDQSCADLSDPAALLMSATGASNTSALPGAGTKTSPPHEATGSHLSSHRYALTCHDSKIRKNNFPVRKNVQRFFLTNRLEFFNSPCSPFKTCGLYPTQCFDPKLGYDEKNSSIENANHTMSSSKTIPLRVTIPLGHSTTQAEF